MTRNTRTIQFSPGRPQRLSRLRALLCGVAMVFGGVMSSGCLDRPVGASQPQTTNVLVDQLVQTAVDKIDLLFVIDNSISMADKQAILAQALPDLVARFVSPICVDPNGMQVDHPESAADRCQRGAREFNPIDDIHIGIITTSLGGYGAVRDCVTDPAKTDSEQTEDMAHLLGTLARAPAGSPPSGFLAWTENSNRDDFVDLFKSMVGAAGEHGCGWEAPLEAWYRFLVEPYPYTKVVRQNCSFGDDTAMSCIGPETLDGQVLVDQVVLDQRKQFLRPDSLMAIIILSDENDCSFRATGQSWRLAQAVTAEGTINSAFRSTSVCETDVNDPCCHSCGAAPPDNCPGVQDANGDNVGPGCENGRKYPIADQVGNVPSDDEINLRCFQQKRRFGVDYLYPVQRYANALKLNPICPFADDLDPDDVLCKPRADGVPLTVANPIFDDLTYADRLKAAQEAGKDPKTVERAYPRPDTLVFLAGIVGVPWEDLAQQDANGDLIEPLKFRVNTDTDDDSRLRVNWGWVVGDPMPPGGIPNPQDPLMVESVDPRTGTHPVTGEDLAGPGANSPEANSINGHEWNILARNDLQYACIFPKDEKECDTEAEDREKRNNGESVPNCDCTEFGDEAFANPLCQAGNGNYGLTQYRAKAYPSIRQLQVLRNFGPNSIVASICPKETGNTGATDFGYRPAVAAIVDRLKEQLSDKCFPRPLATQPDGKGNEIVSCKIVEATLVEAGGSRDCTGLDAREAVPEDVAAVVLDRLKDVDRCGPNTVPCESYRLCAIEQLVAPENQSCLNDPTAAGDGWCYVDPDRGLGSEELVAKCLATERRKIRFAGAGTPENGSVTFFACAGAAL